MTSDLRLIIDAVTNHTRHCRHDGDGLADALAAVVGHATVCRQVDRNQLIDLAYRTERLRLHLVDNHPHPAEHQGRGRD